jgi:hypothetical protein
VTDAPDDDPVLPDTTADEDDRGWGDDGATEEDRDDLRRYLEERPPHHGD